MTEGDIEVATSRKDSEIKFTQKGLKEALELGRSMGMSLSIDGARQFLTGYFAAVDNFHNPDESKSAKNTVTLYLLKESFLESTLKLRKAQEYNEQRVETS